MKWHLNIQVPEYPFKIEHYQKIFSVGSCFAENLAEWLKQRHFNIMYNPNGVLFNPESILINLKNILDNPDNFDDRFLFFDNGYWKSFLHQTHFFDTDKNTLKNKIISIQKQTYEFLKTADYLFITFGSAYVYEHHEMKYIVANCHKLPAHYFQRKLLKVQQIIERYNIIIQQLQLFNANIKVIFSVSPVKYLAYGAVENNISKATLILAVHELCKNHSNIFYFPAYELITDDLRDYRFFKEDMAHPNELAVKYVMEKFSDALLAPSALNIIQELEKILSTVRHQLRDINSFQTKTFAEKMLKKCDDLERAFPYIHLNEEKKYFQALLHHSGSV